MWWSQLIPLFSQSVRLDEAQSLAVATRTIPDIVKFMATDVHPPLYLLLLHVWVQIFGNTIIAARLLSLLFAVITLPVLYLLSYEAVLPPTPANIRKAVARLTVVLFLLSPFVLWFSAEARMYSLFTLAATASHLFFLRYVREVDRRQSLALYTVLTMVGLYTHYFYVFVIFSQFVYLLLRRMSWKEVIKPWIFMMVFVGAVFLPWAIFVAMNGFGAGSQPFLPKPSIFNLFSGVATFLFGFQSPAIEGAIVSMWPLSVLVIMLIFTRRRMVSASTEYFGLVTVLPVFLVYVLSFIRPIFLIRYLIFVLPTLLFLIAWSVEGAQPRRPARWWVTGLLLLMAGALVLQDVSADTPVKENYQGVAQYLQQNATPSDIIALSAPFTVYPMEYTYDGHTRLTTIPEWDRYSTGPIPAFTPQGLVSEVNSWSQEYQRVFVVLSYDQGYQQAIVNYLDTHLQMLDHKTFPPSIDVRVYKLRYD